MTNNATNINVHTSTKPAPRARRNYAVDLFKLLLELYVVYYHFWYYNFNHMMNPKGTYICLEPFFVIAGYYFERLWERSKDKSTFAFLVHRVSSLYPTYIVCLALAVAARFYAHEPCSLVAVISGAFICQEMPLVGGYGQVNNPAWFIAAMIPAMVLLYATGRCFKEDRHRSIAIGVMASVCVVAVVMHGTVHMHSVWRGFIPRGIIRATLGLSVGIAAYRLRDGLRRGPFITLAACAGCVLLIYLASENLWDFVVYPLAALAIVGLDSLSLEFPQMLEPWLRHLSSFCLWLYLAHNPIRMVLAASGFPNAIVLYMICTLVISGLLTMVQLRMRFWIRTHRGLDGSK